MKKYIILIPLLLISLVSFSQTRTVSGIVTNIDTGEALPGVSILIKGTTNGTYSNFDGEYSLSNVSAEQIIEISYLGFESKEVLANRASINIQLKENVQELDGVVLIGYGSQIIKEVTGAVTIVDSEAIEKIKPTRVEEALQGQAGISVTPSSGSPGSAPKINIRGISTNGDSRPLILLDGAVIEDLSVVNPSDIASMSVIKDATAGIYGVRGANGVILITTKSGRKNSDLKFRFDAYTGIQQTTKKMDLLQPRDYAILVNEAAANGGDSPVFTLYPTTGTDWQDQVFKNAPISSVNFGLNGGTTKSNYDFSISHLTQDGIVGGDKSNFNRSTARLNYSIDLVKNLKLSTTTTYINTNRKILSENALGSVLFNALSAPPQLLVRDTNGDYTKLPNTGLGIEVVNPLAQIENTYNQSQVNKISGSYGLNYRFLEYFQAESNIQLNYADVRGKSYFPELFYGSGKVFNTVSSEAELTDDVNSATVDESGTVYKDYTFDAFIKYERKFDKHDIKALLGTSIFKTVGVNLYNKKGYAPTGNTLKSASVENSATVDDNLAINNTPKISFDSRLLSYFTRIQYAYDGKYLASAVLRRDGSTNFGPKNKFGFFPTASVGWVVSEEDFMKDVSFINLLKLRSSYGVLGNDRIGAYGFVSLLDGEGVYVLDNALTYGKTIGKLSNPEIRWEKQKPFDIAIDLGLFDKIDITVDYFNKKTEDLLVTPQVSGILGVYAPGSGAPTINAGTVENKGFEFSIGYNEKISEDFNFNVKYNITSLKNEVLFVGSDTGVLESGSFGVGQDPIARMEAGKPIGYFYGYKTNGVFQTQAEIDGAPIQLDAEPGDLRFVDVSGDGKIDADDKTDLGNPIPDFTMGFNMSVDYKNFDFSLYAFASLGNDIVRDYERNLPLVNRPTYFLDRWTSEGTSNSFPRVTTEATQNSLFSDFYVEDGSYLRLQNIQLGYTVPESLTTKIKLDKVRLYASATNLLTLTNYRGYDPTASTGEPIGGGIDRGFYPTPKTFFVGVNVNF
ncbi:SusC/RagA family TonB-linked outer membrane protein [Wenyingzhuangia fucanilytica]|uniref:SusC/RagA family TonB-linked outer membrane protein n=1 Tax=Wenyingzhuangia fucanilytica TaxID=1790137 RepID=A0A1B1Y6T7_9FLAO|nr:TonB-dependent receptor [Wenyingzhuangia fucanilytica]ANW96475.1 SusC/RagA family TonB-linked outer membrane protein [Wenyingzhuangia fucanilytica]